MYKTYAYDQGIFINADRLCGFAHYTHINRVESELCQYAGQYCRDLEDCMQDPGNIPGNHCGKYTGKQGNGYIEPGKYDHDGCGTSEREAAVNCHICEIKDFKSDVNADRQDAPDKALRNNSGHSVQKCDHK
jgi:hypothetical protein